VDVEANVNVCGDNDNGAVMKAVDIGSDDNSVTAVAGVWFQ
jgi:hypothetical protein